MISVDRRSLQHFDWVLLALVCVLLAMGLANLYSATQSGAVSGLPSEFRRQLMALGLGFGALLVTLLIDYRRMERLAAPVFIASLVLLASTLVLAPITRGNRSWLIYGPFSLQPAELAKIGLILAMAYVVPRTQFTAATWRRSWKRKPWRPIFATIRRHRLA